MLQAQVFLPTIPTTVLTTTTTIPLAFIVIIIIALMLTTRRANGHTSEFSLGDHDLVASKITSNQIIRTSSLDPILERNQNIRFSNTTDKSATIQVDLD